jgi:hypothetical protein
MACSTHFELGMCTEKKQCHFTDQIENSQPTILFQHYGAWFFWWYWDLNCILSRRVYTYNINTYLNAILTIYNIWKYLLGSSTRQKTCTFYRPNRGDNVNIFWIGDALKKQCNFTDQIEDNQPTIWFQHQGTWFFLWYWDLNCILSRRVYTYNIYTYLCAIFNQI